MWEFLSAGLLTALIALHFWWRKRFGVLASELRRHRHEASQAQEEQAAAAHQASARLEALFESMIEGVLVLGPDGRIQLVNESLVRLFQFTGPVHGQSLLEAFRSHQLSELMERLPHETQVEGFELELPGLQPRHFEINAAMLKLGHEQCGTILVFHETTRLHQLENLRKEFVANVSHELRTPLSLIKGYVETLLDGAKDDPVVANRFLRTIDRNADRLIFLIEDLLTISQLESGNAMMNLQAARLRDLVAQAIGDFEPVAGERNVSLENQVAAEVWIEGDPDRVHQVLCNLIDNAVKYGRQGGCVRVQAERDAADGMVVVSVKDDGPGIPGEALERIFERFYRVDRARSREQGGTGLGLSIVKHIIQSHGGRAWAESRPGEGAAFYFSLPAAKGSDQG